MVAQLLLAMIIRMMMITASTVYFLHDFEEENRTVRRKSNRCKAIDKDLRRLKGIILDYNGYLRPVPTCFQPNFN